VTAERESWLDGLLRGELSSLAVPEGCAPVLDGARALAGLGGARPTLESVRAVAAAGHPVAAAVLASMACRATALELDRERVADWANALATLRERHPQQQVSLSARSAGNWAALLDGDAPVDAIDQLTRDARNAGLGDLVLEGTALSALLGLAAGPTDEALTTARRAFRMARTEGYPELQYLTGWVLARARRHEGRPYLAARILRALRRVATPCWRGLLALEWRLAGEGERPSGGSSPALRLATDLDAALGAGTDRASFDRAWDALGADDPIRHDLRVLRSLLDPTGVAVPEARSWCAGQTPSVPRGLHALAGREGVAWIHVGGGAPRRVLGGGRALLPGVHLPRHRPEGRGRVDVLVATLACSTRALSLDSLFEAVWGFAYRPELHRSLLDVTLHRARSHVAAAGGTIVVDGSQTTLAFPAPTWVADPRCDRPVEDQLLALIGARGKSSSKDVAGELGIPRRRAQELLHDLADGAGLVVEQHGRRKEYRIEDTTFAPPTERHPLPS